MSKDKDIFMCLKFAYYSSKILGSVHYTIQGVPKRRKLTATILDSCIFFLHFLLMAIPFQRFLVVLDGRMLKFTLNDITVFTAISLTLLCYLALPNYLKLGVLNQKEIFKLWLQLDRIFRNTINENLEEYNCMKKISVLLILSSYFFLFFHYSYVWYRSPWLSINTLYDIAVDCINLSMMTEANILFFSLLCLLKSVNRSFGSLVKCTFSKTTVSDIKYFVRIHYDLVGISKKANVIFGFIWTSGIMLLFVQVSLAEFVFWKYDSETASLFFIVDLTSSSFHFFPLLIIIILCSAIVKEVSYL